MSIIPEDLSYTAEHEWVSAPNADGVVRVGITDFAQDALGDVVYAQMPEVGTTIKANDVVGEVESTKSVSDIYAPVTGEVVARIWSLPARASGIAFGPGAKAYSTRPVIASVTASGVPRCGACSALMPARWATAAACRCAVLPTPAEV